MTSPNALAPAFEPIHVRPEMTTYDRFLIIQALDYYLRNKKPDPVGGGIPYQCDMQTLLQALIAQSRP